MNLVKRSSRGAWLRRGLQQTGSGGVTHEGSRLRSAYRQAWIPQEGRPGSTALAAASTLAAIPTRVWADEGETGFVFACQSMATVGGVMHRINMGGNGRFGDKTSKAVEVSNISC